MKRRRLRQAWDLARGRRGLDDPETLKAGCLQADALLEAGDVQQAEQVLFLVLPRCENALGHDHPTTRTAQSLTSRVSRGMRPGESLPEDPFDNAR
jgi:hypothetical protein